MLSEFRSHVLRDKTRMVTVKCMLICLAFWAQYRRTNEWTERIAIYAAASRWAMATVISDQRTRL